jgi:hypothetical protein
MYLQNKIKFAFFYILIFGISLVAQSQSTGLYDLEPPSDSAYVRILLTESVGAMMVSIDGKLRVPSLPINQASNYLILTPGQHIISISSANKQKATQTISIDLNRGRMITIALLTANPADEPIIFEDKMGSNKLKAMLNVYQLALKNQSIDILTSDGATKIFSNLAYGTSGNIQVNPISTNIIARKSGNVTSIAKDSLSMIRSEAYSIFLLPKNSGGVLLKVAQNKIERYTSK